jgi:WD40 repeat protein
MCAYARCAVKIISYSAGKLFKVEQSTNSKTPTALSDIQWHPMEAFASWLVAAPTNGKILLYNLVSKESLRRAERTLDDHERTVNRIVWHPTQGELLFSGSQDGTVKMFDLRTPSSKSALTFADGHSVRGESAGTGWKAGMGG